MKKILFILLLTGITFSVSAQDYAQAIGLRLGSPVGLTYKQSLSEINAFEAMVDLDFFESGVTKLSGSAFYLWQKSLNIPDTDISGLSWFAGPGASAGVFSGKNYTDFNFSINGLIGLEYKFEDIPLALSIDFGPRFYFLNDSGMLWGGAVTVRYVLK